MAARIHLLPMEMEARALSLLCGPFQQGSISDLQKLVFMKLKDLHGNATKTPPQVAVCQTSGGLAKVLLAWSNQTPTLSTNPILLWRSRWLWHASTPLHILQRVLQNTPPSRAGGKTACCPNAEGVAPT